MTVSPKTPPSETSRRIGLLRGEMKRDPVEVEKERRRNKFWSRLKLWSVLYALVLPSVLSLALFSYYPKIDVVIMSFFRWEPPFVEEFVGFANFLEAFADPMFWHSFMLVGILLVTNLLKMWPGIFAAIALHRLASNRLRYFFQVMFVVPMIIPMMVWLLIWKSFYDPDFGLLNRFLNATGGMRILHWMDTAMPATAGFLAPFFEYGVNPVFGNVGGLIAFGAFVSVLAARKGRGEQPLSQHGVLMAGPVLIAAFSVAGLMAGGGILLLALLILGWMVLLARTVGISWIAWPFLLLGGLAVWIGELWRLPVMLAVAIVINQWIRARRDDIDARTVLNRTGLACILAGSLLVVLGYIWTVPTDQFSSGTPAWLGNQDLVIPAIIFWGFPWVGSVGVLIYLSGLQNIPQDVYEAAKLEGVGPWRMMFYIELPLIMTQVRINLIFMTIGTLTAYEIFLILLGPDGGPGGKGMVPGLYMFSSAFAEGRFGYACALGMVLFVIILLLTIVYQRYVKVDK
jgi:ABC-type sugar transport system permease subunit